MCSVCSITGGAPMIEGLLALTAGGIPLAIIFSGLNDKSPKKKTKETKASKNRYSRARSDQ